MKYKGVTFELTPTEKFPQMVSVVKTTKKVKELRNKRFLDELKLVHAVDALEAEQFIEKTKIKSYQDVLKVMGADVEIE